MKLILAHRPYMSLEPFRQKWQKRLMLNVEKTAQFLWVQEKKMESVFDKVLAEDPTDLVKGKGRQSDKEAKKSEIASLKHYDPAAFDWSHDDAVEMFKSSAFSPTEAVKKEKKVKVQKVNKKPSAKVDKKPASKKTEKKTPKKPLGEQIVNLREIKFRHVWTYIWIIWQNAASGSEGKQRMQRQTATVARKVE